MFKKLRIHRYIILFLTLSFCHVIHSSEEPDDIKSTWAGVEVFGVNKITSQKIRNLVPIKMGSTFFDADEEAYLASCKKIKEKIPAEDVNCSPLFFSDGTVYLVIEIMPIGGKKPIFRTIPKKHGPIAVLPSEFSDLYHQWDERMFYMITHRQPFKEIYDQGFLDFDDPILHKLVLQLSKYAYKYNDALLDIILYSPDDDERRKAATLLVWAKHHDTNLAFILKHGLLNDPNKGVRNYLSRSFSSMMPEVKDKSLLKMLLPMYCSQATLPEHTDRNKALFSIMGILEEYPELTSAITPECKSTITYISEVSILDNVGGKAGEILDVIQKSPTHG